MIVFGPELPLTGPTTEEEDEELYSAGEDGNAPSVTVTVTGPSAESDDALPLTGDSVTTLEELYCEGTALDGADSVTVIVLGPELPLTAPTSDEEELYCAGEDGSAPSVTVTVIGPSEDSTEDAWLK